MKALLLSGGYGNRLSPLTDVLPKCLMPIRSKPLLEIWIDQLLELGVEQILVNTHYLSEQVIEFLGRKKFKDKVHWVYEKKLLGTAGTLIENIEFFGDSDVFLAHADNFCTAKLQDFYQAHINRPECCVMTMMSFQTSNPKSCGILELENNILVNFYEKVENPPSNCANGAVYLLSSDLLSWLKKEENITDFSIEVIPKLLNKIQVWENTNDHIDIGTINNLLSTQNIAVESHNHDMSFDEWEKSYKDHKIHALIKELQND